MIKDLVKDDAVLSQPCDAVTAEEAAALTADLTDTLESLENVACLHANQLGVTKAAFIYLDADDNPHIMFNAKMIRALGAFKTTEDCLSREEESKVTRYTKAKISYQELAGDKLVTKNREFTDWTAEIIQHMSTTARASWSKPQEPRACQASSFTVEVHALGRLAGFARGKLSACPSKMLVSTSAALFPTALIRESTTCRRKAIR